MLKPTQADSLKSTTVRSIYTQSKFQVQILALACIRFATLGTLHKCSLLSSSVKLGIPQCIQLLKDQVNLKHGKLL